MKSKHYTFIFLAALISLILVLIVIFTIRSKTEICVPKTARDLKYPEARRDEKLIDDFFGTKVADPYRWLEDPDSRETKQFIDAENEVTEPFLKNCGQWQKFNKKLTSLWNYPKYSAPERHGKYYFSYKNTGLQNQNVWYKQESLTSEPTVFLDPNTLSSDGTVALQETSFSEDGKLLAYGLSESGSDWMKIKVRDVETGKDFPELLERIKFTGMSWTHDNKGFFYSQYPNAQGKMDGSEILLNEHQKLYYHRIGQPQSEDVLIADLPDNPSWRLFAEVSHCGRFLFLDVFRGVDENKLYFAKLEDYRNITGKIDFKPIAKEFGAYFSYVANIDFKCIFYTNKDAQNYRLISIDLNHPEGTWTTLVPEDEKDVLDSAHLVDQDKLVLHYFRDAKSVLQVRSLATGQFIRNLPLEMGQVISISGNRKYSDIFYELESFLTPGTVYQYNFSKPEIEPSILNESKLNLQGFDKTNFTVAQVFYPSKDGTSIPMFIVQKKKSDKTGPKPCLLYGYGGFGYPNPPEFSVTSFYFIDAFDGVLAFANIRGGGEYKGWHNAGRLLNKQKSYDDFQAAAEYLIRNKFTETKKLAIQGISNGGLLVGACINQRPDLFGAAIAHVGVMDMLRFPKFTIGQAWISEYGSPNNETEFKSLYKISPLHNIRSPNSTERQYPSTLILTADHDDRVSPLHSLKYTAALHHAIKDNQYQKNPILLRIYTKAGHGWGKPTSKRIDEATDILSFLYRVLPINATI